MMDIALIIILLLFCILTIVLCFIYINKTYNSIDKILEKILSKDTSTLLDTTNELMSSKLKHKVKRIVEMNNLEVLRNNQEKETLQSLISDMSHQMKTPLTAINMYSDILKNENLSQEEQKEFFNRIKISVDKLDWIMDNLVKMSRLETGVIQLSTSDIYIKQTILNSISSVIPLASSKNISINIDIVNFDDIKLFHDPKWTQEVFVNILENAIKYSHEYQNNEIKISLEQLSLFTKVIITNYGIGVDKEDFNLIFKRFYRGQNAHEYNGVGLGLYLATLIMEKQGGYVMVDSKLNEFTSFSVFLQNCKN